MDYTIRSAEKSDLDAIADMAMEMHPQSSFAPLTFSRGRLIATLETMLDANQGVFVAEVEGKVVGCLVAYIARPYFSMDWGGYEHALYVAPGFRKGRLALALVETFVNWAKAHKVRQIRPATSTGEIGRGAAVLYRAAGFEPVGETFVMTCEVAP